MFVLPRMMAPASTSFCTVGACTRGTKPRSAGVPAVFGIPATCVLSFTTSGTPWSGPRRRPAATSASARWASASAAGRASVMNALRSRRASARASSSCMSSALVTCLSRISRAASATPTRVRSAEPERGVAVAHPATARARAMAMTAFMGVPSGGRILAPFTLAE